MVHIENVFFMLITEAAWLVSSFLSQSSSVQLRSVGQSMRISNCTPPILGLWGSCRIFLDHILQCTETTIPGVKLSNWINTYGLEKEQNLHIHSERERNILNTWILLQVQLLIEIGEVETSDPRGGRVAHRTHVLRVVRGGPLARDPHHAQLWAPFLQGCALSGTFGAPSLFCIKGNA